MKKKTVTSECDIGHINAHFDEVVRPHIERLTVVGQLFPEGYYISDLREDIVERMAKGMRDIIIEATEALREFESFLEGLAKPAK